MRCYWFAIVGGVLVGLFVGCLPAHAERTALTNGPGDDTEAAWSPDGRTIVFQSDRSGTLDLYLLDVATGKTRPLVQGPGHACFPAWSPDGKWIAYAYAHFTKTGFEGIENGYNLFVVGSDGRAPRRLTAGLQRDYCPTFAPDGQTICFSSSRGGDERDNGVSLFRVPLAGGEPILFSSKAGREQALVQPSYSPDGKHLAYGMVAGFRGNWVIRLGKTGRVSQGCALTDVSGSFYGPRWSPLAPVIACTGFQVGDPGWNVYLIHARTGQKLKVTSGDGNSRSPAWSPDGKALVYENNRSGQYRLYRIDVPAFPRATQSEMPAPEKSSTNDIVLRYTFPEAPGATVRDQSPCGNDGQVRGELSWKDGGVSFGKDGTFITVPGAEGFDFGANAFSVAATVLLPEATAQAFICMGEYPGNRLGWQLYLHESGHAYFNSRTPDLKYCGARSDAKLPLGQEVTLVGVRDDSGQVRLYVDGVLQQSTSVDAFYSYGQPTQIRIGRQYNGPGPFTGWIREITVYRRALTFEETAAAALARFWEEKSQ